MVEIAARRFAPARPANFGVPPPGAVMGDPLSVPEAAIAAEPVGYDNPGPEPEPLWLRLPSHLAPYFDLGFCHTEEMCPYVVLRARDDATLSQSVEVGGPWLG